MDYQKLITDSYALAKEHKYLQWFAAIPMMGMLIIDLLYVPLRYGDYFVDDFYSKLSSLFTGLYSTNSPWFTAIITIFIVAFVFYFLLSAFFEGSLIAMVHRIITADNKPIKGSIGLIYGAKLYPKLLKLHALTGLINPVYIFIIMSLLFEYNPHLFGLIFWPMFVVFIIMTVVKLGISFSEYDLVISGSGVMKSLKNSSHIVIFNFKETLVLFMIVILIIIRAIINLLLFIIVPVILAWFSQKILLLLSGKVIEAILITVGVILYYFLVRFSAFIYVMTTSIWVQSYHTLSAQTNEELEYIPH